MHVHEDEEEDQGAEGLNEQLSNWLQRIKNCANILQDIQSKILKREKQKEEE